jgi:hypothetical protein
MPLCRKVTVCFVAAAGLLLSINNRAESAMAFVGDSRGWGGLIVAGTASELDSLIAELGRRQSGIYVRLRCNSTGWMANYYSSEPSRTSGESCGYRSENEAQEAARQQCIQHGGSDCRLIHIRYDDASYSDRELKLDGLYHLKGPR